MPSEVRTSTIFTAFIMERLGGELLTFHTSKCSVTHAMEMTSRIFSIRLSPTQETPSRVFMLIVESSTSNKTLFVRLVIPGTGFSFNWMMFYTELETVIPVWKQLIKLSNTATDKSTTTKKKSMQTNNNNKNKIKLRVVVVFHVILKVKQSE